MKKILWGLSLCCCLVLIGCGKQSSSDIVKKLSDKIEKIDAYYIEGTMEIINNEDTYTYDVNVAYKVGDFYRVELENIQNNHEQVILRNEDGVYVITPSLNKSFKFQSDWPYNNSQSYLLGSIVDDIKDDENRVFEETSDGYTFTTKVNYPNNAKLVKQIVYLDKDLNINKVEVLDNAGNLQIKMTFDKTDLKSEFKDDYFDLNQIIKVKEDNNNISDNNINNEQPNANTNTDTNTNTNTNPDIDANNSTNEETKETATLEDIIYPMYLPENTYLTNQEKVSKDDGERLILTFDGDSPFMLIEETVKAMDEHVIVPTYGDLEFLANTVAVINDNSVNWIDNNIEYYVISDVMNTSELLEIARSISVLPVSK